MTSNSLAAMSNEPQTMTIGGRTYTCGQWQMGDYAKVERIIRGERREELLDSMRFKMMGEEIVAAAVAAVQNNPITLRDMLAVMSARAELVIANLRRNDTTVTEEHVRGLSPMAIRKLVDFMSELSGLMDKDDDADPTTSSTPTEGET